MQRQNLPTDKTHGLMKSRELSVHYRHYRDWPTRDVPGRDQLGRQGYCQPQTDNRNLHKHQQLARDVRDEVPILMLKKRRKAKPLTRASSRARTTPRARASCPEKLHARMPAT